MFISIERFPWIIKLFLIQHSLIRSNIIINYVIDEELPVLYCVGNVIKDSKFNSTLLLSTNLNSTRFIIYAEDNVRFYFSLNNKTGDIFQSHRLDRETVCETHLLSGSCKFKFLVFLMPKYWFRVTISVRDINDNIPTFRLSEITISIKESEKKFHSFPLEPAIDNDLAQYSVQSYLLLGVEKTFSITYEIPMSLNLVIVDHLDYDNVNNRVFVANLIACDGGNSSKCGQQKLTIKITDVNDNKPKFLKSEMSIKISEFQQINSVIFHAKAIDIDSDLFGKIGYKFSTDIKMSTLIFFRIDSNTGEIRLIKSLETRKSAFLILKIIARDESGSGPFSDEMILKIYIQSENNHQPKISLRQLPHKIIKEFSIYENSPPNTYIGLIMVEDADKFENGQVECKLNNNINNIEYFYIQLSNKIKQKTFYVLKSALDIDCEKQNIIPVTVECFDFGRESKSTSLTFNVRIIDRNEYLPEIIKANISESVLENSPPGVLITKISAKDKDFFSNISYHLVKNTVFKINSITGELFTFQHLDRESLGNFVNLTVLIIDNGLEKSFSVSSQITIKILDINDNIPILLNKTHFTFKENLNFSSNIIVTMKGHDPDLDENGTIQYEIHSIIEYKRNFPSFNNRSFEINSLTGEISICDSFKFDYETTDRYEFKLILKDNGLPRLSNKYNIIFDILDVNDNAPVWIIPNKLNGFHINITGQPDLERPFYKLQAQDYDSYKTTNLTYRILYNENEKYEHTFFLSSEYGYLYLKTQLNFGVYELKVEAVDNGIPPLKSKILNLVINVHPNVTNKQTFSISITMMGVTIFLVSGLTLTILLGLGYLCKTKCHLHQSLMDYSKTSELKIKEFYPQNNDSDDIELKMASTNIFQPFYNEPSAENNYLSHIQLDDRFLNQNNTNTSGLVKSPVVCHELECSSTDSGHGASDENQYNSDRANQILKQLTPQMCCYTLLPSVSYNQCGCLQPTMISLGLESLSDNTQPFNQILTSLNPSTVCCSTCQEINISSSNNLFHITHSDYTGS